MNQASRILLAIIVTACLLLASCSLWKWLEWERSYWYWRGVRDERAYERALQELP